VVTELYGYLPAFLATGGLEIVIAIGASGAVWRITRSETATL
jgi:hypothetical protein